MPEGLTAISGKTFSGCANLTAVTIPGSVTTVSKSAFAGCSALTDVYYGSTRDEWQMVTIANGNDPLFSTHVTIHYNSGGGMKGDVNGDNTVDAKDLTALARHVARIETITNATLLKNADVTREGGVTAADLTKLARYVARIISEL